MGGMQLALAPMQDVTDLAFVRTLARIGSLPDVLMMPYFRSTRSTCVCSAALERLVEEHETGLPLVAQLAGSEPAALTRDARRLMARGVAGINLNAGCPSPLVNRHGAGAALLREPARLAAVLAALRAELPPGAFSVKLRLGWASAEEFPRLLEVLAQAAPDAVMVHARTRQQLYGGAARWSAVRAAAAALSCPVWINGDIDSPQRAREAAVDSGCARLMIGRGAVRHPYLFRQLRGGAAPTPADRRRYFRLLIEETGRALEPPYRERGHCNRLKKYLAFCYAEMSAEQEWHLRRCERLADLESWLELEG